MKSRTIPIIFLIVAIFLVGAFFFSKTVLKINDKDTFRAKVITPVSGEQNEVSEKYSQSMDSEK